MIPEYVGTALALLRGAGFEAYPVGGCVRDLLRGEEPHDWDVTTSAQPPEIKAVFRDFTTVDTGIRHGTVTVLLGGRPLEITTFRTDGGYLDHRHPTSVTFVSDLTEDLRRRDFTVNAMALGEGGTVIDPFGGQADLRASVLRAVGDPRLRFEEDALRILRAIRFCAKMGFDIEPETMRAMEEKASLLAQVSGERIYGELQGIVMGDHALKALLTCAVPLSAALPEIKDSIGFDQRNRHHIYDVWEHTARALQSAPKDRLIRLALLFHDIGKTRSKRWDPAAGWTFHNHNFVGAKMVPLIFRRNKLPMDAKMKYVQKLVDLHMRPIAISDDIVTDSAVRRLINDAGEDIDDLIILCEADITSKNEVRKQRFLDNFRIVREKLSDLKQRDWQRELQPVIDGNEVMEIFNLPPSQQVGMLKKCMKDAVLDNKVPNQREPLMQLLIEEARKMGLKPVS